MLPCVTADRIRALRSDSCLANSSAAPSENGLRLGLQARSRQTSFFLLSKRSAACKGLLQSCGWRVRMLVGIVRDENPYAERHVRRVCIVGHARLEGADSCGRS